MSAAALDPTQEELFLGIAYALFMNRLHVLRLTEVVRHGIRPNPEDGNMEVPEPLDAELKQQAVDYVLKCFPQSFAKKLASSTATWLALS
ncbi:MAG TPA: hypothetical protein VM734_15765 [Kofleriaceae bacterium]|nr:hypothetical protein [Kofleriaceae bacterium]